MSGRLTCPIIDVAPLLPHSGNMVLLDEILDYDEESLQGRATIREDHVFLRPEGVVPAWMAMEILAQGIAALRLRPAGGRSWASCWDHASSRCTWTACRSAPTCR